MGVSNIAQEANSYGGLQRLSGGKPNNQGAVREQRLKKNILTFGSKGNNAEVRPRAHIEHSCLLRPLWVKQALAYIVSSLQGYGQHYVQMPLALQPGVQVYTPN